MKQIRRILLLLTAIVSMNAEAQQADNRVAELINTEDWFSLEQEYSQLKDSVKTDFLKLMAEAMICWKFNQKENAITAIENLLSRHQEEIGSQTSINFAMLRLRLLGELGKYADAADGAKKILNQLTEAGASGQDALRSACKQYYALQDYPALSVSRPHRDVEIPFTLQDVKVRKREDWMKPGKKKFQGYLMTVPVIVHDKRQSFIFDTGASHTIIMEKTARDLGLCLLPDTIVVNGNRKVMRAYVDSLQVGDITVHNLIAYIGLPNALDSIFNGIDAVLGMDFISAVGETRIFFEQGKILFPDKLTPMPVTGRNLTIEPLMKATKDGKPLLFNLDTGNTTAELYAPYYKLFQAEVDAIAEKDSVTSGTYGNVSTVETLFLPHGLSFQVGSTPVSIDEINILPDTNEWLYHHHGRMGMDLIRRFGKTTINFRDMFVKFEDN